jgi:hypothetical protein
MTPRTLRHCLALLLAASLAAGWAQASAGVTLGWTAQVDALVHDVPPEASAITQVTARGEGGADVAVLTLQHEGDGRAQLRGTLPDLRGSPLLQPITSEAWWPCTMQATRDAGFAPSALGAVGAPAVIELASGPPPAEPAPGYRQLLLVFADADVRVHGACLDVPTALQVDLYLRPGWNLITSELLVVGEQERVLLRATGAADLDGVSWRWRDVSARQPTEVVPQRP